MLLENGLDLSSSLAVELARERRKVLDLELRDEKVGIVESSINLGRAGLALGKVVTVLGGATDNTLVLLCSVLGRLLDLLVIGSGGLVGLLLLLCQTFGLLLGLLLLLCSTLGLGLLFVLLLVLLGRLLLSETLDALVEGQAVVYEFAETDDVLGLSLLALVVVLALDVTLLITVLVVVGNILVEVLERSPRIERVPEVVEGLDLFLCAVFLAESGHGLVLAETSLAVKDLVPQFVESLALRILLGWGLDVSGLVDRVELTTSDGIGEDLGGLLDALEERVVLVGAGSGLLVGVVLENLATVGLLDLLLSGLPAVSSYAENSVVILAL